MPTTASEDAYDEDAHAEAEDEFYAHCRSCDRWCGFWCGFRFSVDPEFLCKKGAKLWAVVAELDRRFAAYLKTLGPRRPNH